MEGNGNWNGKDWAIRTSAANPWQNFPASPAEKFGS
jgi:hypothetical protein